MLATGVDLIEVERVARSVERFGERFLNRVFTPQERAILGDSPPRLAARFAAKEAVAKALGTGIGAFAWRDIEIGRDERGAPFVTLHGPAAARAAELGLRRFALSLSHTHEHAIAFVVAT
ncbi:MAG: holo-ACP synthase [Anaerolineae bacterium]